MHGCQLDIVREPEVQDAYGQRETVACFTCLCNFDLDRTVEALYIDQLEALSSQLESDSRVRQIGSNIPAYRK